MRPHNLHNGRRSQVSSASMERRSSIHHSYQSPIIPHSFVRGLKPSFSANPSHHSPWACVQIADATLSGNSLRQTVYTRRASVHQAAKLVAAFLRLARVQAWRKVMAAYRRVYDSRHLHADCQEPGSVPEPYARLHFIISYSHYRLSSLDEVYGPSV